MFENITLHNFQCHEELSLKLDRITTLVGPSDSGKTAILRAIDWLCFNKGKTSILLRRGSDVVSVDLKVDGHVITRSTKDNSYTVDGTYYNSIGKTIPTDVTSILKMTDDNIQRQHNYLFWFTQSGSGIISCLNKIVDLTKLDEWVKTGTAKERELKDQEKSLIERCDVLQNECDSLSKFEVIDVELSDLESDYSALSDLSIRCDNIHNLVVSYEYLSSEIANMESYKCDLEDFVNTRSDIDVLVLRFNSLDKVIQLYDANNDDIEQLASIVDSPYPVDSIINDNKRLESISDIIDDIDDVLKIDYEYFNNTISELLDSTLLSDSNRLRNLEVVLDSLEKLDLDILNEFGNNVSELSSIITEIESMVSKYNGLVEIGSKWKELNSEVGIAKDYYDNLEAEFKQKLNGRCPICGSELEV